MQIVLKQIRQRARRNGDLFLNHAQESYSYTSSTFCNHKKEQGLFTVKFQGDYFVLLSSLDETIVQQGNRYHLAHHKYPGVFTPEGNKYISVIFFRFTGCRISYGIVPVSIQVDPVLPLHMWPWIF